MSVGRGQEHVLRNHNSSDIGGCCHFNSPLYFLSINPNNSQKPSHNLTAECSPVVIKASSQHFITTNFCYQVTDSGPIFQPSLTADSVTESKKDYIS